MNEMTLASGRINGHLMFGSLGEHKAINILTFNEYGNVFYCDIDEQEFQKELPIERAIQVSEKLFNKNIKIIDVQKHSAIFMTISGFKVTIYEMVC